MNGKVVAVLVAEGQAVEKGQRLVVVEAMKMQHEMTAPASPASSHASPSSPATRSPRASCSSS